MPGPRKSSSARRCCATSVSRRRSAPSADARAIDRVRARIADQYAELLRHDPGVRVGDDPEDLHDLRVAARRLRALLRAADVLLVPEWSQPLRDELKWLGGELGPARDLDVLLEHLRAESAALGEDERGVRRGAAEARSAAGRRPRAPARRSGGAIATTRCSKRWTPPHAPRTHARSTHRSTSSPAAEFKRLAKAVKRLGDDPTDEALHNVRIKGKRARYAAELAEPVVGQPAARVVTRGEELPGRGRRAPGRRRRRGAAARPGPRARLRARRSSRRAGSSSAQRRRRQEARAALPGAWAKLERAGRSAWA